MPSFCLADFVVPEQLCAASANHPQQPIAGAVTVLWSDSSYLTRYLYFLHLIA